MIGPSLDLELGQLQTGEADARQHALHGLADDLFGPAIELLDDIDAHAANYQPYWAVRAHVLRRLARGDEATAAYDRAVELATDPAVRSYLQRARNARPR